MAPAAVLVGLALGRWIAELVLRPTMKRAVVLAVAMILVIPAITGGVDLYLRSKY